MSPTIFIYRKYRFFFNSREEKRRHIHIDTRTGVAKFWLEPIVSLADYHNVPSNELTELMKIVNERKDEIIQEWNRHFNQ
jgi:hypothetical protein